jgi:hypothetical protein
MAATVKFLEADGATIPPSTVDLGHAVAGVTQTARKFALENTADRILGASPFLGSELQRAAYGTNDGVDQLRIGLDTATLSAPYGITHTLGAAGDGGVWAGTGNIFHRITATNATGETIGSVEVVTTVDVTTKRITLGWTQVAGATGYRVWRSTASGVYGPTALRATIAGGAVVSHIDNGAALSSGTIPTANTSGGAGPAYGTPPTLDLPPLSLGSIPIGQQVFFWVNRVIPGATAEAGNDRIAFVKFAEL